MLSIIPLLALYHPRISTTVEPRAETARPVCTVVMPIPTADCRGCLARFLGLPNGPDICCASGAVGGELVVSNTRGTGDGSCENTLTDACSASGTCEVSAHVEVLYNQSSCLGTIYISGPGTAKRQPIGNSWNPSYDLTATAPCSSVDHTTSTDPTTFEVWDSATGGTLLASYSFRCFCGKCAK